MRLIPVQAYTRPARRKEARSMSLMRVCQPLPVALSASRTSASRRSLTACLVVAWTLPSGRPRARALIWSGVCTAAYSPRWAWARDSRSPGIADLDALYSLAEQHQNRVISLDEEFITAVIRPPVSIRKVRAMAKKQERQPVMF